MTQSVLIRSAVLALCATCAAGARADYVFADGKGRLSGFGTLAGAHIDSDQLRLKNVGQVGRGIDNSGFDFGYDSKVGGQVDYRVNSQWSGTLQLVSQATGDGDWLPTVEWAFLRYAITPEWAVRAGRIGTQFFMLSDFRQVNYANLWVRPPSDVYNQVSNNNFDGADLTYKGELMGKPVSATVYAGRSVTPYLDSKIILHKLAGFNMTVEPMENLSVRFGYGHTHLIATSTDLKALAKAYADLSANPLAPLLGMDPAVLATFGSQLGTQNKSSSFTGLGVNWDSGEWLVSAEYTLRTSQSYIPRSQGMYASVGRRIHQWTPFVFVGRSIVSEQRQNPLSATAVAASTDIAALNAGTNLVLQSSDRAQRTLGVGVRYDLGKNFALKGQLENLSLHSPSGMPELAPGATSQQGKSVNVVSMSVDFVF